MLLLESQDVVVTVLAQATKPITFLSQWLIHLLLPRRLTRQHAEVHFGLACGWEKKKEKKKP